MLRNLAQAFGMKAEMPEAHSHRARAHREPQREQRKAGDERPEERLEASGSRKDECRGHDHTEDRERKAIHVREEDGDQTERESDTPT